MMTTAVVIESPERLSLKRLELMPPGAADVVVDVDWSGISTGTERLLWSGQMPPFPGLGYPLVPGYESVGRVIEAGANSGRAVGEQVFVPGAACFGEVRGLFGGTAQRVVIPGRRALPIARELAAEGVLLALTATAHHALKPHPDTSVLPDLVVGHGVLGRIVARLVIALGGAPPVVWESNPARHGGAIGYPVAHPDDDDRHDYRCICDVSGDSALLNSLISRLAKGGEIVLAGFYSQPLSFDFPPAFMREARIRIAAEWQPGDLQAVTGLLDAAAISLDGLITHRLPAARAEEAYRTAFFDATCLKMILDWRDS